MNKIYEWSLALTLSLTFMSYYWWGASSALIGIYIPAVVQSLIFLLLINLTYKKKLRKKGLPFLRSLLFLGFLLIFLTLYRTETILPRTLLMNQRILLWIIVSILITFLSMRGISLKKSMVKSVILWFMLCFSTLLILVIFGEETLILIDVLAADGESNINVVKDGINGLDKLRFVIPGLNSNTVAIQCAIGITIVPFFKLKYLKFLLFFIFLITGFLTYSRMFFVFLGIFILVYSYYNRSIIPVLTSLLVLPIVIYVNPIIYYRFLNTIDSIFSTNYSYGLTKSSSDRSTLINDSFSWLSQYPFGGNLELMDQIAPGAAGEHLLYIFLANINGLFFGLIFFLISLYLFIRTFKMKYKDISTKTSLISLSTIVFISALVAPSFYIQLIWWPIIYFYDE